MLLIYGVALAIGPITASFIMEVIGRVGMFTVTAAFHLLLAGFTYLRMRIRAADPVEDDRTPFQPVVLGRPSTPETYAFDPRSDEMPEDGVTETEETEQPEEQAAEPDTSAEPDAEDGDKDKPAPEPKAE